MSRYSRFLSVRSADLSDGNALVLQQALPRFSDLRTAIGTEVAAVWLMWSETLEFSQEESSTTRKLDVEAYFASSPPTVLSLSDPGSYILPAVLYIYASRG